MDTLLDRIADAVLQTGNIANVLLFGAVIWLGWQLQQERSLRVKADEADREYAERHTQAITALATTLAKLEGVISAIAARVR